MSRGEERRQAREAESDMKKFYYLFGAVAVIGIGVVGLNVGSSVFGSAVTAPIELEFESTEALVELAQGVTKGDPDAPVTLVEFGDYQCPGCAAFALSVKPQVEATLIESGQVQFVFYDFPLVSIHGNAFLAARASRCADDQGKFWEYHDLLFRNQSRWAGDGSPSGAFSDYAEEVGLDSGEFGACLNSDKYADVVTANMELGLRMSVTSTPTVIVNAGDQVRHLGSVDFQTIAQTIENMTSEGPGAN